MPRIIQLQTERLILRQWKDEDLVPFADMNADSNVMEYFPARLNSDESNQFALHLQSLIQSRGWGLWALELKQTGEFIGYTGLNEISPHLLLESGTEIGWRLAHQHWGKGYTTEAAKEVLRFAFISLQLEKLYSITSTLNRKSIAVMERIGMKNTHQNFAHPDLPENHKLSEHVLYEINLMETHFTISTI